MMRIKLLPQLVANQIAAGEVIERPASVIKEVLENCLDAGSDNIQIAIEKGGSQLIRVQDNGCGIHHDDLSLALTRHGTSKIYSLDDLEKIHSLGFRGEALASIASIARIHLISRDQNSESAWQIKSAPSEMTLAPSPIAHPIGTTIAINDLFFNTPARRKFLRSEKTEFMHIEENIRKIALSRFDVRFELHHNEKKILTLSAALDELGREQRIDKLCGSLFVEHMVKFKSEMPGFKLSGWLGLPSIPRENLDIQYFYVNGRAVKDRVLAHAIKQAYQEITGRPFQPAYILYFELDTNHVDVNVHPTKHEVRFQQSRLIHDFVVRAIMEALRSASSKDPAKSFLSMGSPERKTMMSPDNYSQIRETFSTYDVLTQNYSPIAKTIEQTETRIIGFFYQRYLFVEESNQLKLIDALQAKAHMIQLHLTGEGSTTTKPLLIPETVILPRELWSVFEKITANLLPLGIGLEFLGEQTLIIRALPACLSGINVNEFMLAVGQKCQHKTELTQPEFLEMISVLAAELLLPQIAAQPEAFYSAINHLSLDMNAFSKTVTAKDLANWF